MLFLNGLNRMVNRKREKELSAAEIDGQRTELLIELGIIDVQA